MKKGDDQKTHKPFRFDKARSSQISNKPSFDPFDFYYVANAKSPFKENLNSRSKDESRSELKENERKLFEETQEKIREDNENSTQNAKKNDLHSFAQIHTQGEVKSDLINEFELRSNQNDTVAKQHFSRNLGQLDAANSSINDFNLDLQQGQNSFEQPNSFSKLESLNLEQDSRLSENKEDEENEQKKRFSKVFDKIKSIKLGISKNSNFLKASSSNNYSGSKPANYSKNLDKKSNKFNFWRGKNNPNFVDRSKLNDNLNQFESGQPNTGQSDLAFDFSVSPSSSYSKFQTKNFAEIANHKLLKIICVVGILLFGLLYLLPKNFNNSSLKFYLTSNITKALGANFSIKGDVELAFFPTPRLIAKEVFVENYHQNVMWHSDDGKQSESNSPNQSSDQTSDQVLDQETQTNSRQTTNNNASANLSDDREVHLNHDYILNFYAKSLEIKLSFFGKSPISKLLVEGGLFEFHQEDDLNLTNDSKFKSILSQASSKESQLQSSEVLSDRGFKERFFRIDNLQESLSKDLAIPSFEVRGSELIFVNDSKIYRNFKEVHFDLKNQEDEIKAGGSFVSEGVKSKFEADFNFNSKATKADSYLKISSEFLEMVVSGVFAGEKKGIFSDFQGKIEAEIKNFKKFYRSFISNEGQVANSLADGVGNIKASAQINNKNQEIAIQNLAFSSNPFSAKFSIFGRKAWLDQKNLLMIDIEGEVEKLDIDKFWLRSQQDSESKLQPSEVANLIANFGQNSRSQDQKNESDSASKKIGAALNKVSRDLDLSADLKFQKIIFNDSEFNNASLYLTIANQGKVSISPLIFRLGNDSIFRISGIFDNNKIGGWKFVGNFDSIGEDFGQNLRAIGLKFDNLRFETLKQFRLYCDLSLNQESYNFSRIYLNLNSGESEITGEIKFIDGRVANLVASNLRISRFRVEDYLLTQNNSYFSPGSLTKKMFWLNDVDNYHDLNLKFDELVYKDQSLINHQFHATIGPGYITIPSTQIRSQKNDLSFELSINTAEKNQIFKLGLNGRNLMIDSRDVAKATNSTNSTNNYNFFDRFYNLPSFEKFGGVVAISLDNLQIDNKQFGKFSLKGNLIDGVIKPLQIGFDAYGGHFDFKGLLKIDSEKIINGSFAAQNAELAQLIPDLLQINSIAGTANISGNIVATASNKSEFLQKLNSEISIGVRLPTIQGYGINDLIRKMFQPDNFRVELSNPQQILFNESSKSAFKEAKGFAIIKGGEEGRFKVKLSAPVVNSIFYGNISIAKPLVNGTLNTIFLTGNGNIKIPLNIAMNLKYQPNNLVYISNVDQVRQYLGLSKEKAKSVSIENGQKTVFNEIDQMKEKDILEPSANSSANDLDKIGAEIEALKLGINPNN